MCRLAAFPPGMTREDALRILERMLAGNRDGVGSCYVKDGEFVTFRYPGDLEKLMKSEGGANFLAHMPYNGWTIAHLRAASHGVVSVQNTHPFIKGEYAVVHNGIFSSYRLPRLMLEADGETFEGETDTEVAASLIKKFGPKKWVEVANHDGVFLVLDKRGTLHALVTSGSYSFVKNKKTKVCHMASELHAPYDTEEVHVDEGWLHFDKQGRIIKAKYKKGWTYTRGNYTGSGSCGGYGGYYGGYGHYDGEWYRGRQGRTYTIGKDGTLEPKDKTSDKWDTEVNGEADTDKPEGGLNSDTPPTHCEYCTHGCSRCSGDLYSKPDITVTLATEKGGWGTFRLEELSRASVYTAPQDAKVYWDRSAQCWVHEDKDGTVHFLTDPGDGPDEECFGGE